MVKIHAVDATFTRHPDGCVILEVDIVSDDGPEGFSEKYPTSAAASQVIWRLATWLQTVERESPDVEDRWVAITLPFDGPEAPF